MSARYRYRPSADYQRAYAKLYGRTESTSRFRRGWLPDPTEYYRRHLHALRSHGEWAAAHCPFHEDKNPSFSVNLVHGGFCCRACGVSDSERHRFPTHSPVSDDAGGHDLNTGNVRCAHPLIRLKTPTKAGKFLPVSAEGGSHFAECFGRQSKRLKPDYALT
jgi:hypothetical protein